MDSLKMRMLLRVYGELVYNKRPIAELKRYADSAKAIALKLPNRDNIRKFYFRLGVIHHGKGEFAEALEIYKEGIALVAREGDKNLQAGFYMSMSDIYNKITDYTNAIDVSEKAIKLFSEINDQSGQASIYNNLSSTYIQLKDFTTAYKYATKALPMFEADGLQSRGVGSIKLVIANILLNADEVSLQKIGNAGKNRYLRVIKLMKESIPIAELEKDLGLKSEMLIAKATSFEKLNQLSDATRVYEMAVAVALEGPDLNILAGTYATVGRFFHRQQNNRKGINYLHLALAMATQSGLLEVERETAESLSNYYEHQKQMDSAFYYYKRFSNVENQIFNKEKENEFTRKKLKLDFSIKEKEYAVEQEKVNQQLAEKKLEISFKNKLAWLMGILTIVVITAAWFFYKSKKKTQELNATIEAQRQSLSELVQVKDQIFSILTHDMRSPVNSLISFVYLLENDEIDKDQLAQYAKELGNTLRGTSALMENLLNWAGTQLQGFETSIENVSVKTIVEDVVTSFSATLKQKNIQFNNSISENDWVLADKNLLALVIRNLISNALKFSYTGKAIWLRVENNETEVMVCIVDEGMGMSAEAMEQINKTTINTMTSTYGTNKEKGTGLGLMLCKSFLSMMSGKLSAKSNQPQGCIMAIHFPKINC
ncbi:ATP-binding protein [Sediminibacterium sp.]|uniref:ATP-binding protein n=1 Tax=Sediminibacterium sp. TaxID=1917865 RepID=UPI0027341546|nr:ATP-binding protein [Sediminibacterium sp.]MDP3393116.1 ATP-binding protein [Sediminibacterium sp.]MDP3567718.1 ATP-binding protein [Sediminibacterium sp.]